MPLYPVQDTWVRGELSPRLHARASLDLYRAGLSVCENFLTLPHGGLRKRGGGYFVDYLGPATLGSPGVTGNVRLFPFIFSADQAYCLEFGDMYLRIFAYGANIGVSDIATPWPEEELDGLQIVQSADVMWITHPDYAPQVLTREAALTWTLEEFEFTDGPYKAINLETTTLTPADYGAFVPKMTGNTAPSGTVSGDGTGANEWQVFDKNPATDGGLTTATTGYVRYQLAAGAKCCDAYWVQASSAFQINQDMPTQWTVEGSNDGVTWVVLDSQINQTGWSSGERRFYEFKNKTAFSYIQMKFAGGGQGLAAGNVTAMAAWEPNESPETQAAFNLTASSTTGINDGSGFLTTDVGRSIRILGSDSKWRWCKIISRSSSTVVTVKMYGHALPDLSPMINWRMSAFEEGDWPSSVGIYEERLAFAQRFSIFLSKTGLFEDFATGEADDDALEFTNAGGGQANDIVWIADADGFMLIATAGGIRALSGAGIDEALTPSSFKNRKSRTYGAAPTPPVDAGSSFVYVGRTRRQLVELTQTQLGRFATDDIGQVSEHIPKKGIVEITYQADPDPIIWFPLDTGELGAYTHQPSQEVRGMHRHILGGAFGSGIAVCERALATPGQNAPDDLWVAVKRTINGNTTRHLDIIQPPMEYGDLSDSFFVDGGLTYSGAATNTLTGLTHLIAQSVDVLYKTAAGKWFVAKGRTVSGGGSITLPNSAQCVMAHVGLPYTATAKTLELDVGGRDGSLMGRPKKINRAIISVFETDVRGLEIRSMQRGEWETVQLPSDALSSDGSITLYTGNIMIPIDDSWEGQAKVEIRHTNPTPCTIRAFTPVFEFTSSGAS